MTGSLVGDFIGDFYLSPARYIETEGYAGKLLIVADSGSLVRFNNGENYLCARVARNEFFFLGEFSFRADSPSDKWPRMWRNSFDGRISIFFWSVRCQFFLFRMRSISFFVIFAANGLGKFIIVQKCVRIYGK